jgi:hypothetical protein
MRQLMTDRKHEQKGPETAKPAPDSDATVQEELQREADEGKGLIGDEAQNRNLSGSSTWETLSNLTDTDG